MVQRMSNIKLVIIITLLLNLLISWVKAKAAIIEPRNLV